MGAPGFDAAFYGFQDARVLIQTEETVGAEVDDRAALDFHDPIMAHAVHDQVF